MAFPMFRAMYLPLWGVSALIAILLIPVWTLEAIIQFLEWLQKLYVRFMVAVDLLDPVFLKDT